MVGKFCRSLGPLSGSRGTSFDVTRAASSMPPSRLIPRFALLRIELPRMLFPEVIEAVSEIQ